MRSCGIFMSRAHFTWHSIYRIHLCIHCEWQGVILPTAEQYSTVLLHPNYVLSASRMVLCLLLWTASWWTGGCWWLCESWLHVLWLSTQEWACRVPGKLSALRKFILPKGCANSYPSAVFEGSLLFRPSHLFAASYSKRRRGDASQCFWCAFPGWLVILSIHSPLCWLPAWLTFRHESGSRCWGLQRKPLTSSLARCTLSSICLVWDGISP